MLSKLEDLVRIVKKRKVFKRNKKSLEVKVIAGLLYFFGLSTRKTSEILSLFEEISHESVRKYYHSLRKVFKEPRKKRRRLIAVDETVLKVGNARIYVWTAIDVDTMECLGIWVSTTRNFFDAMTFIKSILKYCKNKPTFVVDKGPWYPLAFYILGLKFKHETFGNRNAVESFFSTLKKRTKAFYNHFPHNTTIHTQHSLGSIVSASPITPYVNYLDNSK